MIIAFDAKRAFHNATGLGNYSRTLIDAVRKARPDWRIVLYSNGKQWDLVPREWSHAPSIHMVHNKGALFRSYGVVSDMRFRRVQAYHGLSNELPWNIRRFDGKKIVTVHDVIFRHRPGDYPILDRKIYDLKTSAAVKNADAVISISPGTTRDLVHFYGVPEERIHTIYQDVDPLFHEEPDPKISTATLASLQLPDEFWLFPGVSHPRKNFPAFLQAWQSLPKDKKLPLVVTGPESRSYGKKVRKWMQGAGGTASGIYWIGSVDQSALHCLYAKANMVMYPSLIEGFGLPVLESLYSGTPVLISEQLGFEEWAGQGVLPIDVTDPKVIADALLRLHEAGVPAKKMQLARIYGTDANLSPLLALYGPS